MGYEYDCYSSCLELLHLLEKLFCFSFGQGCSRLVKYQHLCSLVGHSTCDFHHLAFAYSQVAYAVSGLNGDVKVFEQRFSLLVNDLVVAEESVRLSANKDILSNRQIVHHIQLLMNDGNACFLSFLNVPEMNRLTKQAIFTRVVRVNARHDLHERRLARAVFTY